MIFNVGIKATTESSFYVHFKNRVPKTQWILNEGVEN